jgi:hypothetical protein
MTDEEVYISLLSSSERIAFVAHLNKRNKRSDTKNIHLFSALVKGKPEEIKLGMTANAYSVLKKRLTDRLADFAAGCLIETEQTIVVEITKILVLSQRLFKLNEFKTGYKQLRKAELKAKEVSEYHLLNEIYHTYIQYSYHELSPVQEELFEAYEQNKKAYDNYANLTMVYALVRKAFQNQEQKQLDLDTLISQSFTVFGITNSEGYTFQSLSQIAEIVDIYGSHTRNYYGTDLFFEKHLNQLQGSKLDTEKQLPFHINLLYLVAHIYFRKKDFTKSMHYLNSMHTQMQRYNHKYYEIYKIRYTTLLALTQNFSGNWKEASILLDEIVIKNGLKHDSESGILQAILARSVIHLQQEEHTEAKQTIAKLWQQDSAYLDSMGFEWLINKKFIEILIAIELGDSDYVDSLIASLLRKRAVYFKGANSLAFPFLKLIEAYHKNPEFVKTKEFESQVESTFEWKPSEEEDLFFISYYAWLKSKMIQKPVYELTLSFLRGTE